MKSVPFLLMLLSTSTALVGLAETPAMSTLAFAPGPALAFRVGSREAVIFRLLADGTEVAKIKPTIAARGPKVNYSVTIGTLPAISLHASTKRQFAVLQNGPSAPGKCFKIHVSGFKDPKGTTDVTDTYGVHTIDVNKPSFLCTEDSGTTFICFQVKVIACSGGPCLPPGTDRNEEICSAASLLI